VFIMICAGAWLTASVCIEQIRQMSSAMPPMCGRVSLSSMPAVPYR